MGQAFRTRQRSGRLSTRALVTVLALSLLAVGSPRGLRAGQPEGRDVANEVIGAYGGRDALVRVSTLSLQGRITSFFPPDAGSYALELKRPDKLLVDITYRERRERRVLNRGRGYSGSGAEVTEVQGMAVAAMIYQYDQMDLPFGLADGTLTMHLLRRGTVRGRPVEVAEIRDREGKKRMEADIDRADHRILRTAATFGKGGEQAVLSAEFGEFRKVRGVLLPFLITNYAGDFKISETRIETYIINGAIDDAVFSP